MKIETNQPENPEEHMQVINSSISISIVEESPREAGRDLEDFIINEPSAQSDPYPDIDISPELASFLICLSRHGLLDSTCDGKAVFADDQAFNRTAMKAKFTELGLEDRLLTFPDGM